MDADPNNRPTAEEILKTIAFWKDAEDMGEIFDQMDDIEYDPSTIPVTIHPDAVYTSRILKSTSLPQPRNSNKVTIVSNNYGNYITYLIQQHHH